MNVKSALIALLLQVHLRTLLTYFSEIGGYKKVIFLDNLTLE